MARKLTWFPWDVVMVETDEDWRLMSDEERGLYMRLLNHSWLNGGLPADENDLTALIGCPLTQPKWAKRVWKKFVLEGGRLVNRTQEEFRASANRKSEKATASIRSRYERSTNEPIRASSSISSSSSEVFSSEESARETTSPNRPTAIRTDDSWDEFEAAATQAGMGASSEEWVDLSAMTWPRLSFEEKLDAVQTIRRRVASGEYRGDKFTPLARSYLEGKHWTRPDRKQPKKQLSTSLQALAEVDLS